MIHPKIHSGKHMENTITDVNKHSITYAQYERDTDNKGNRNYWGKVDCLLTALLIFWNANE